MKSERQTVAFERSAEYWLARAAKRREKGDIQGAAVFYRAAARRSAPGDEARRLYAEILHEMHCPEASNREAFDALASSPDSFALYGIIAENMSDMGLRQEAIDSFSLFLERGRKVKPDFNSWDYDYFIEESFDERIKRKARLNGLLNIATRRLAMGDIENATIAVSRARRFVGKNGDPRRDSISAALLLQMGEQSMAYAAAKRAVKNAKGSTKIYSVCADLLRSLSTAAPEDYKSALFKMAVSARVTRDELIALDSLIYAKAYGLLACMLMSRLKAKPHSVAINYTMSLCMLLMGSPKRALRYAHICRELDPDDPYAELLLTKLSKTSERLAKGEMREVRLCPYGTMSGADIAELGERLMSSMEHSERLLAERVCADPSARMRYISLLTLGADIPTLTELCGLCPRENAEAICRAALTAEPEPQLIREAMAILTEMGAKPPYVYMAGGRILSGDPSAKEQGEASFLQRRMIRLIKQAEQYIQMPEFAPLAMRTIHGLSRKQRLRLLKVSDKEWALALAMLVKQQHGLKATSMPINVFADNEKLGRILRHYEELQPKQE